MRRDGIELRWSKRERDYVAHFSRGKWNANLLLSLFHAMSEHAVTFFDQRRPVPPLEGLLPPDTARLRAELRARGLDPDTLRISVSYAKPRTP